MLSPVFLMSSFFLLIVIFLFSTELGARISYRNNFGRSYGVRHLEQYPPGDYIEAVNPPLFYRFKTGFHSAPLNINRLGLRGPEPATDGLKKRLLFIGESNIFGSYLENESRLWSVELAGLLEKDGHNDWEVINGGFPMYNSAQQGVFWAEALDRVQPAAIIVSLGVSDIFLAWLDGEDWEAEMPLPEDQVFFSPPKPAPLERILEHICLYYFISMLLKDPPAPVFPAREIKWENCRESIIREYRRFYEYASQKGIPIAFTTSAPAYSPDPEEAESKRLAGLQLNYQTYLEHEAPYLFDLAAYIKESICPELDVPYIDLYAAMMANPGRLSCYYDLAHWNPRGMNFIAKTLYQECKKLNWFS